MSLLFIPALLNGDIESFLMKLSMITLLWGLVILASGVDLITGIHASKRVGKFKTTSKGLRRTIIKDLQYFAILIVFLFLDFAFSYLALYISFFNIPCCTIGGVVYIMWTELWSVNENVRRGQTSEDKHADVLAGAIRIVDAIGDDKSKRIFDVIEQEIKDGKHVTSKSQKGSTH